MIEKNNSSILGDNYIPLRLIYRIETFISRFNANSNLPKVLLLYLIGMLLCNVCINISAKDSFNLLESKLLMLLFGGLILIIIFFQYSDGFWDRKYYDCFSSIGFKNSVNIGDNNRQIIIHACQGKFDYNKDIYWNDENHPQNKGSLLLGESLFNKIYLSLNDYPHILIGGATGSGKTLLLKLILMQCINNGFIVNIADFKGGVDFGHVWENHCTFVTDISNTTKKLDEIIAELENRKKLYSQNGYKNISDYNEHELIKHKRIIFACDELAELLDTTGLSTKEKEPIRKIQNQLSSLARLGRAFGIHLILATQRPDANIISGQIKNNISYKICGRADQVLSQIILDNTDASIYIPSDSKGLFLNQDGTLFKAYLFDETRDIQGGGRMHTEQ